MKKLIAQVSLVVVCVAGSLTWAINDNIKRSRAHMPETVVAHEKAAANAAEIKRYGWRLTTPEDDKKIFGVLLPDGIHPVLYGTFTVEPDPENGYATWQETPDFKMACPLSSIVALKISSHYKVAQ